MRFTPFQLTPPEIVGHLVVGCVLTCLMLIIGWAAWRLILAPKCEGRFEEHDLHAWENEE